MGEPEIDLERIDEAVLALMFLTLHEAHNDTGAARAWKGFDWEALCRLHEKAMIHDPVGKAKSVMLTPEGVQRSKALFYHMFGRRAD